MAFEHKLINMGQSSEERISKYRLCRDLGASVWQAQRMRDWRLSKIERLFDLVTSNKFKPVIERIERLYAQQPLKLQFNKAS